MAQNVFEFVTFWPQLTIMHFCTRKFEKKTGTATRSYWTRKRAFQFYSPGVVRRSHAAVRHVRALSYARRCCYRCCSSAGVCMQLDD